MNVFAVVLITPMLPCRSTVWPEPTGGEVETPVGVFARVCVGDGVPAWPPGPPLRLGVTEPAGLVAVTLGSLLAKYPLVNPAGCQRLAAPTKAPMLPSKTAPNTAMPTLPRSNTLKDRIPSTSRLPEYPLVR